MSKSIVYKIEGMTCASCAEVIEDNGKRISGVESVLVNFAAEKAEVKVNENYNEDLFKSALEGLGYRAISNDKIQQDQKEKSTRLPLALAAIAAGIVSMGLSMGPLSSVLAHEVNNWIQLVLSVLVLLFLGKAYFKGVLTFLKSGRGNMNTLIGLGVIAAFIYSATLMLMNAHAHVYFETIPFIIGFTYFGHYLEDKAKTKAKSGLGELYKLQLKFAKKITPEGEVNTPVIELKKGDAIKLRPGDKIPLDGIVLEGITHVDESMITGESKAVEKKSGDLVYAGSLNLEGTLSLSVSKPLNETFVSEVIAFVEKAQMQKAPIQKIADTITRYFVPFIIVLSLVTFFAWWFFTGSSYESFSHMIAVLLIACPCALGLAVPMAVMLSTVEASKRGLLIGGGEVIERASSIDAIVFDKTGTLTEGHPVVIDVNTTIDEKEFLEIVGSIVQYSNHPLSKSITHFIKSKNIAIGDPDKFKDISGKGIESEYKKQRVLIGSEKYLREENINIISSTKVGSHVHISCAGQFIGTFVIADPIKKKASEVIHSLKERGYELWMLTGDNEIVAKDIANQIGLDHYKASVLPVDKANFVSELKAKGKKVAMIGDGINDAPALTAANLGIAMGGGSDIAIHAADVSILEGRIEEAARLFLLSKKTMRVIKENLFLSFFYNVLCLPLAAGAFYSSFGLSLSPMWASLAMGLSSVSVILSSLRLKKSI